MAGFLSSIAIGSVVLSMSGDHARPLPVCPCHAMIRDVRKAGLDYQDLVALIEAALDSEADVKVGEWIKGPDGRRELDVSIRGIRNGAPYFAFVECKDYRGRKVGIGAVDELDSKRRDLGADLVALYSNSDYTAQALQKARRVGINTFAAVAMDDSRTRAVPYTLAIGRLVEVVKLTEQIIEPAGQDVAMPPDLNLPDITFEGNPVHNWIASLLTQVVTEQAHGLASISNLTILVQFRSAIQFDIPGVSFYVTGMQVLAELSTKWMGRPLPVSADLAQFDFQTGLLIVPPDTSLYIGVPDEHGWEEIAEPVASEVSSGRPTLSIRAKLQSGLELAPGKPADLEPWVESIDVYLQ